MRFTTSQTSFRAGRLSPKLLNRIDTEQYRNGASVLEAMKIIPEGGVERMKGYRVIHDGVFDYLVDNSNINQFSFSIKGNSFTAAFRQIKSGALEGQISLVLFKYPYTYATETESIIFNAGDIPVDAFNVDEFDWTTYQEYLVITHYSGILSPTAIKFDESGVVAGVGGSFPIGFSPGTPPLFGQYNPHYVFPMSDIGKTGDTLTLSNQTATATTFTMDVTSTNPETVAILKRSSVIYMEGLGQKNFGDSVNRNAVGSDYYLVISTLVTNGVKVQPASLYKDGSVVRDALTFLGVSKVDQWAYPLWYGTNQPRTVTTNEGRLVFGGTFDSPLAVFASKVNNPFFFAQLKRADTLNQYLGVAQPKGSVLPTDPYLFTISGRANSRITFLETTTNLVVGTDKQEFVGTGGDTILSAVSVSFKSYTAEGSSPISSVSTGSSVFFISNLGKKLIKFRYNSANGTYISQELSLLFSDLLDDDRILKLEWAAHISSLLIVMESGKLYAISDNDRAETNSAFYDTKLDGVADVSYANIVETVAGYERGHHIMFAKAGIGMCSCEHLFYEKGINASDIVEDSLEANQYLYLDKAISMTVEAAGVFNWNGQAVTPTSGTIPVPKELYGGATVYIINLITGYTINAAIPVGTGMHELPGDPEINVETATILMGVLPRPCMVATMPVEAGQQWGSAQMGVKNIDSLAIRFYKSYTYQISSNKQNWQEERVYSNEGNALTGRKEMKYSGNPGTDQIIYIRNTKAEPLCILGINIRGMSNDG